MSGPWEKYKAITETSEPGPWDKYAVAATATETKPYTPQNFGQFAEKTVSDVIQSGERRFAQAAEPSKVPRVMREAGAIAGAAGDVLFSPITAATNLPANIEGLPETTTVGDVAGGMYNRFLQTNPIAKAAQNIGSRFAQTELGKNLYGFSQTPEGKALTETVGGAAMLAGAKLPTAEPIKTGAEIAGTVTGINKLRKVVSEGATGIIDIADVDKSILKGVSKGIKPTVVGKKTMKRVADFYDNANVSMKTIAENKDKIKLIDENGEALHHPRSASELAQAIDQTKKVIYKEYHDMATAAGEGGAKFEVQPIIDELTKITGDGTYETLLGSGLSQEQALIQAKKIGSAIPDFGKSVRVRKYASEIKNEISELQGQSPEVIESRISELNSSLQNYYANPDRINKAKAAVDASTAALMRKMLDEKITSLQGEGYQELKNQYGALTNIEKEVNHRAIINARKNVKGLPDLTDIFTGGELLAGLLTGHPSMVIKGATGIGIKELYKKLTNPDRFIEKMSKKAFDYENFKRGLTNPLNNERGYVIAPSSTANAPDITIPPKGTQNASEIRGNKESNVEKGIVPERGENIGGENIQRNKEAGGTGIASQKTQEAPETNIRPNELKYTRKQRTQLALLRENAEKDFQRKASEQNLTADEIAHKRANEYIDKKIAENLIYDRETKQYVRNPNPEAVKEHWASKLELPRDDREQIARIEQAREKSKSLPRENEPAKTTPEAKTAEPEVPEFSDKDIEDIERIAGEQTETRLTPEEDAEHSFFANLSDEEANTLYYDDSKVDISSAPKQLQEKIEKERAENLSSVRDYQTSQKQEDAQEILDEFKNIGGNIATSDKTIMGKNARKLEDLRGNLSPKALEVYDGVARGLGYDPEAMKLDEMNDVLAEIARIKKQANISIKNIKKQVSTKQEEIPGLEDTRSQTEKDIASTVKAKEEKRKSRDNPLEGTMFDRNEMEARATKQESLFENTKKSFDESAADYLKDSYNKDLPFQQNFKNYFKSMNVTNKERALAYKAFEKALREKRRGK
jgi:hypothetical protein